MFIRDLALRKYDLEDYYNLVNQYPLSESWKDGNMINCRLGWSASFEPLLLNVSKVNFPHYMPEVTFSEEAHTHRVLHVCS